MNVSAFLHEMWYSLQNACFSAAQNASQVNQTQEPQHPMATTCLNRTEKMFLLNGRETGSHLVQTVISKLHSLQILTCDHRLLRRIALVETNDGISGVPDGGIWALNESKFNAISSDVDEVLSKKLCLNVPGGTTYEYLKKPLVSGLCASLYLNYLEKSRNARIPLARKIEEQAKFWNKYYHTRELTTEYFVEQVKTREGK